MTIGEIIKKFRENNFVTMDEFAQKSGLSKGYISMLEKNENPKTKLPIMPTTKTLQAVAKALNISVSELMDELNEKPASMDIIPIDKLVAVPVVGLVRAGYGGLAFECDMGSETVDANVLRGYEKNDFFYLRVKGDSMEPRLYEGDLVLVRKQTSIDSGSYGVVTIDDEEGVVKIVEYDKNSITLISQNHNYPPRKFIGADVERIRVIGKVIESKSKFI
ncbi:MAG: helix-turn-helix domain-containing protein [Clostridia bacterium]|nr:helix-turn-helix domain-containing protein [Clostridia bacterium]